MEWLNSLSMTAQLFVAASVGMGMGIVFCWFGEVLTPDDLV